MSEIKEAKSLRWLAIQFPLVENPKDDIEKLQSCINLYCTAAAEKIEQLTEENEKLQRLANLRQRDLDNSNDLLFKAEDEVARLREELAKRPPKLIITKKANRTGVDRE